MVSKKIAQALAGSSVIRAMFNEGKEMAARYGAENVYDFSLGNPATPAPESVNRSIQRDRGRDGSVRVTWLYVKFRI